MDTRWSLSSIGSIKKSMMISAGRAVATLHRIGKQITRIRTPSETMLHTFFKPWEGQLLKLSTSPKVRRIRWHSLNSIILAMHWYLRVLKEIQIGTISANLSGLQLGILKKYSLYIVSVNTPEIYGCQKCCESLYRPWKTLWLVIWMALRLKRTSNTTFTPHMTLRNGALKSFYSR